MASRKRNIHFSGGEWVTFTPAALPPVKERALAEPVQTRCVRGK